MRIGAVVVTYNSAAHIGACLDACQGFEDALAAGIVVIDNASADSTREVVTARPFVRLISNPTNCGFAAAVNQGFRALPSADAILLLNPDAEIRTSPRVLASVLDADNRIAVASGTLVGKDGRPQTGFQVRRFPTPAAMSFELLGINRLWPSNPVNRAYRAMDMDPARESDVDQPAGACLLIRRAAWEQVHGFDEAFYPLWFEDVDFLQRLQSAGWRMRYTPAFRAGHSGAHSIASLPWASRQLYWYGSLFRYGTRHFHPTGQWMICGAAIAGLAPRMVTGMLLQRSCQPLGLYVKLVRLAGESLKRKSVSTDLPQYASAVVELRCGSSGSRERADL